eukprot:6803907-Pyramimonas_sp.AAC.1
MEIQGAIARKQPDDLPDLVQVLGEPPAEFHANEELAMLLNRTRTLSESPQQDIQVVGPEGFSNNAREIFFGAARPDQEVFGQGKESIDFGGYSVLEAIGF